MTVPDAKTTRFSRTVFTVNGRTYRPPARPVVTICIDGCGDEYLSTSIAHGKMPHVAALSATGYRGLARAALPTFTNVNNCAIVTGTPPAQTGIAGNYILDPDSGEAVMTNDARFLRNDTILAAAAAAGRRVAMVTAKDKLRGLLSKGLRGIAFSAEKAAEARLDEHGIADVEALVGPAPSIYSAQASLYTLRAGVVLLETDQADFLYLSLTDYMQHRYRPSAPESLEFYGAIDEQIGKLLSLGAVVGITADHGMNGKTDIAGRPNVIYLQTELAESFGDVARVICPITDPYVVHHGALGSAVTVYLDPPADASEVAAWILSLEGVTEVFDRPTATTELELPAESIGDLMVLSGRDYVIGARPEDHDLSQLAGELRSHGGRYEEMVPLILSGALNAEYSAKAMADPRNFDLFDFVCNGASA